MQPELWLRVSHATGTLAPEARLGTGLLPVLAKHTARPYLSRLHKKAAGVTGGPDAFRNS